VAIGNWQLAIGNDMGTNSNNTTKANLTAAARAVEVVVNPSPIAKCQLPIASD